MRPIAQRNEGERMTLLDFNRLSEAANTILRGMGGSGVAVNVTSSGLTVSSALDQFNFVEPSFYVDAHNIGTSDLDFFDVVQITEPLWLQSGTDLNEGQPFDDPYHLSNRCIEIKKPVDTGFGRFAVCMSKIDADNYGPVCFGGICLVKISRAGFTLSSYLDRGPDRAHVRGGRTYLQLSEVGSAQVLWMFSVLDPVAFNIPDLSLIRFDHRNTDGVAVSQQGGVRSGVAEVLIFESVFQYTKGVVTIQ